jgi:AAA+ superfamily predicted ATPase
MQQTLKINQDQMIRPDEIKPSSYADPLVYLSDELELLDLKLLKSLYKKKTFCPVDNDNGGSPFYISDEEVCFLLKPPEGHDISGPRDLKVEKIEKKILNLQNEIRDKMANTDESIVHFPLKQLVETFRLDTFEAAVLLMALALETDKKYERIFAYFNDDLNKKAPSLDTAFLALKPDMGDPDTRIINTEFGYFSSQAPLRALHLIRFVNQQDEESILSKRFRIDPGIRDFLLKGNGPHPRLCGILNMEYPTKERGLSDSIIKVRKEIQKVLSSSMNKESGGLVFWLHGRSSAEKESIVSTLCAEMNIALLKADFEDILLEKEVDVVLKLLLREAILKSAALFIKSGDLLTAGDEKSRYLKRSFLYALGQLSWFSFIDAREFWIPENIAMTFDWYPLEVKSPDFFDRRTIWAKWLQQFNLEERDLDSLAGRYTFSENRIIKTARHLNLTFDNENLDFKGIAKACGIQASNLLPRYSKKISPHYTWDDLVLPDEKQRHLKEVCHTLKNKHIVYFRWGFDEKLALGRGLNILFTGPSGTGKTMTAEVIASDLGLDLHKVDLSSVVSKYIGETEKNLKKIFDEAASGNTILFFDEADALFGKRTEVKDAHDRYANIEINYLLQKMEEHESVIILSSNFGKNIDNAFLRRMQFTVEFPFPGQKYRELMWRKIYPEKTPLSGELNFKYLAKKLKVSGGNIKNIALASAFLAAEEGSKIEMKHILNAARREYQKIGKVFVNSDFHPYSDLIGETSD